MVWRRLGDPSIFSVYARAVLIVASLGLAIYLYCIGQPILAAGFLVAAVLCAYGYFRYGTTWIAFREFQAGRYERAESLLNQIANPDLLRSQDRAFYEMLRGFLAGARGDLESAKGHFQTALRYDLRTGNNRSLVECGLAEVFFQLGDERSAREHLELARQHEHRPDVELTIRKVEALIEQAS